LMALSPAVVRRTDLETLIWSDDPPDSDLLRSHLYKLRRVVDAPFQRQLIHTIHRIGYRLAELNHDEST